MKYLAIATVMLILLIPNTSKAQQVFCHGYVYDATDSTAIDSAHVDGTCITSPMPARFHQITDANGYYCEPDTLLPSGNWNVTASHSDYFPQLKNVTLPETEHVNFYLQPRQ